MGHEWGETGRFRHLRCSKVMIDASLLHHAVGCVSGQGATIHGKCSVGYGAIPNLVVALTLAAILAAGGFQGLHDLPVEALTH